ncbi:MAG: phosphoenolpyruvate carboxylase [Polyangiaceae bacterium]|nr:phosphoenolpyruvate carboxylase [Polyangiaceae bacterium]
MSTRQASVNSPLHDDVRWLTATLGETIRRLEGETVFQAVEALRVLGRKRRQANADFSGLMGEIEKLELGTASKVARAFSLLFFLINIAEQVQRVRRREQYEEGAGETPQPASLHWALLRLKDRGYTAEKAREVLTSLEVRPVLTAHPTESKRRTLLALHARLADALLARGRAHSAKRRQIEEAIVAEVELLWLTDEVRRDRPSVMDEVTTAIWYLEGRLLGATEATNANLARAFLDVYQEPAKIHLHFPLGSWVGGDRDGNPFVTPEVSILAARRSAYAVVGHYRRVMETLTERLSVSDLHGAKTAELRSSIEADKQHLPAVWEANRRRDRHEPVRLKLTLMHERLGALQKEIASRDRGKPEEVPGAYQKAEEFLSDLGIVRDALVAAKARHSQDQLLEPLISQVEALGFFGYRLDFRDDADVHTRTLKAIAGALSIPEFSVERLREELTSRRPLLAPHIALGAEAEKAMGVFYAMRTVQDQFGERAASTYIISMARSRDDLLRVLLLAREASLVNLAEDEPTSRVDVVPLFETRRDLENAPAVFSELISDPVYRRQLKARGNRQEIMIGYSDSAKDVGVLGAAWLLYEAQEKLTELAVEAGIKLTIFHGQGGTVGRGGGSPVYRALTALPPNTVTGAIKITEQGEVISQKFDLPSIAERSLEVMFVGTLFAMLDDYRRAGVDRATEHKFRQTMKRIADASIESFRRVVHDDTALFDLFTNATPLKELAHVHYGSRPAYRPNGAGTMTGIRAIPWNFGWTQIRLMPTAWLGVGSALGEVIAEPGGLELLQNMAKSWPFFADLLSKIEMVCAKAELDVARLYVSELWHTAGLYESLEAEYHRTVAALLAIRGQTQLLGAHQFLPDALKLRNAYVDPLSALQVHLLKRKRELPEGHADLELINQALGATLNGIAQGMRNTG